MNRLVWKELNEQRYASVAYGAVLATILVVWFVMGNYMASHGGSPADRLNATDATGLLLMAISWSGLLVGSSAVANEVGRGTASFLYAMLVSRVRIWCSKILVSLGSSAASSAVMVIVYLVLVVSFFGHSGWLAVRSLFVARNLYSVEDWTFIAATFAAVLGIASLASALTDRPLAAFGGAAIVAAAITGAAVDFYRQSYNAIVNGCNYYNLFYYLAPTRWIIVFGDGQVPARGTLDAHELALWSIVAAVYAISVVYAAAYLAFRNGATNRTWRRFLAPVAFLASAGLIPGSIVVGYLYVEGLALMDIPVITSFSVTTEIPNDWKSKPVSYAVTIDYGRVRIGKTYSESSLDAPSMMYIPGVRAITNSPDITATIVRKTHRYLWHKSPIKYRTYTDSYVEYTYKPELPYGNETSRISLLAANGHVVDTIDIRAHKTAGFFPPRQWFGFPQQGLVSVY